MNETVSWGNTGALRVSVGGGRIVSAADLRDNQWYHVAAVLVDDGSPNVSEVKLYVDGAEESITYIDEEPINTISDGDLLIGVYDEYLTTYYFAGLIDEVCIFDIAMSSAVIEYLYQIGIAAESNLVGYWDFNEGTGQVAGDKSGNGNDGQLGSTPSADLNDPFWFGPEGPEVPVLLVGLEISGPNEVFGEGSASYYAYALYDDGSTLIVTDLVEWSLSSEEFAVIDPNGLVVAGDLDVEGEFSVYASYAEDEIVVEAEKLVSYLPTEFVSYFVDGVYGNDANDGLTPETAFATIQHGIDATENDDSVLVSPTVYFENIDFTGKAITVRGIGGVPVIDGTDDFGVSFTSFEDPNSVLKNFVVTGSYVGVLITASSPTICNVNIIGNKYGIDAFAGAFPGIINCILWENTDADISGCQGRYSCIQREDQATGEANISGPPLFVDPNNGDYHLLSRYGRYEPALELWICDEVTSQCINAGDPAINPADETAPNGGRINIGAYGGTAEASRGLWALEGDLNQDGVVNVADFAIVAGNWLDELVWMQQ